MAFLRFGSDALSSPSCRSTAYLEFLRKLLCKCMLCLPILQDFACSSFGLNILKPHICLVQNIYELWFNKRSTQRFFCLLQLLVSFVILKKNLPLLFHQHQKIPHKVPATTWMLFLNGIPLKFLPMNHNGLLCTPLLQDPPQQHRCWHLLTRGSAAPLMLKPPLYYIAQYRETRNITDRLGMEGS